jgi:two-component system, LytTR family, response regulator
MPMTESIRAVIADDEPVARAGLRDMLGDVDWISVAGEAGNGLAAVETINRLRPDIAFLDVQMPGLLGTDVLARLQHKPLVVFTTAYAQHAATAFELGALDYLLKPFGPERLRRTLERVRVALATPAAMPSAVDRLKEAFSDAPMTRLFVRSGGAVLPVAVEHVAWFESSGDYVVAHTGQAGKQRYMLHLPLSRLETRLDARKFMRVHRTRIVNLDHVAAFRPYGKSQLVAELRDGTKLVVSRERAKDIRALGL